MARVIGGKKPTGRLAAENLARSPGRTTRAASALMIGVTVIIAAAVLASSISASLVGQIEDSISADVFVRDDSGFQGFDPTLAEELRALPEVTNISPVRINQFGVDKDGTVSGQTFWAVDPATFFDLINVDPQAATLTGDGQIMLETDLASELGVGVGDTLPVTWPSLQQQGLEVVGLFDDDSIANSAVISLGTLSAASDAEQRDQFILGQFAPDTSEDVAIAAVSAASDRYPTANVQNRKEFQKSQESQVDQLLWLIYGLLGLALLIAAVGIATTISLSVLERTREIGLLRSIGMTRRGVRRMVIIETIATTLFGALLGIGLGLILGVLSRAALVDNGVERLALPFGIIVIVLIVSVIGGVVLALFPATRASRLNVLDALAEQ
jgi:putative ABC transport system permease protein